MPARVVPKTNRLSQIPMPCLAFFVMEFCNAPISLVLVNVLDNYVIRLQLLITLCYNQQRLYI